MSTNILDYNIMLQALPNPGQVAFRPVNAFSFYSPTYVIPEGGALGPEFQLEASSHVVSTLST